MGVYEMGAGMLIWAVLVIALIAVAVVLVVRAVRGPESAPRGARRLAQRQVGRRPTPEPVYPRRARQRGLPPADAGATRQLTGPGPLAARGAW